MKAASASSWSSVGAITNGVRFGGSYSFNATYDARVRITDALGSSSLYIVSIPSAAWVMKFRPNGNGVAFGKAAESDNVFEVAWKAKFNSGVEGITASEIGAMPQGDTISLQKSDSVFSTQIIAQAVTSNISLILPTHSGYIRTIDAGFELPATGEEGAVFFLLTDEEEQ